MGVSTKENNNKKKLKKNISKQNVLAFFIALLILVGAFGIYEFLLTPQIHLKGKKEVVLGYQKKYSEKGYDASFLGKNVTSDVVVKGKVDSNKLGTYDVIYEVKKGVLHKRIIRTVKVKDIEKPKLEIDDSDLMLCPGSDVVPEKIIATDDYDKDLTDKVESVIGEKKDSITYKVCDKSKNCTSVTKKIIYGDVEDPVITLNGGDNISVFVGNGYEDQGVTVSDNCDTNIQSKVVVDGGVNSNQVGNYEITYSVEDDSHNKASVKRNVRVKEKGRGIIYLTFDDGPNSGTTDVILNVLKEEGVKATFFVTNKGPDELIKREYDEGHTVALHTASHDYAVVYASDEAYFNDCFGIMVDGRLKTERIVLRAYGLEPYYLRDLPVHHTQKVIKKTDEYTDYELRLRPAEDFIQYLLSLSTWSRVLEPEWLVEEMQQRLKDGLGRYE